MAIKRAQFTTIADFAAWLQENAVPSIFKSVTYDSNSAEMTATDADNNTVWTVKIGNGGYFRAYRAADSYIGVEISSFPNTAMKNIDCILCDNGLIVDTAVLSGGNGRNFAFMIAKTNNEKLAFIFRSTFDGTANNQYKNSIAHVAFGDSATIATTTTFTPESGQQTIMTTFATNADITQVSYTPKAFYMPMHSAYNSGIGKFLCGGKVYITNGYWCIDTETYEEDAT